MPGFDEPSLLGHKAWPLFLVEMWRRLVLSNCREISGADALPFPHRRSESGRHNMTGQFNRPKQH